MEEYVAKKDKEKKLNREKTKDEELQEIKELNDLPKELEEIKVLYRKDPTTEVIDLSLYLKEILQ